MITHHAKETGQQKEPWEWGVGCDRGGVGGVGNIGPSTNYVNRNLKFPILPIIKPPIPGSLHF